MSVTVVAAAIMGWNRYPLAIALAADAFADIAAIFAAVMPYAFSLMEAAGFGLVANPFLLIRMSTMALMVVSIITIVLIAVSIIATAVIVIVTIALLMIAAVISGDLQEAGLRMGGRGLLEKRQAGGFGFERDEKRERACEEKHGEERNISFHNTWALYIYE